MVALILATALMLSWSPEVVIKNYLRDHYPWPEIDVQPVKNNRVLPATPPEKILLIKGLPGRSTFLLQFPSGRTVEYQARVEAFDWVVRSRRPIRKGEIIDEKDVYRTLINIKQISKGAAIKKDTVVGRILRQSIPANRTITGNLIEDIPVIKKGQKVILLFDNGRLRIITDGVAKENGHVGKYIKVTNRSSRKQILGKIVDDRTVRVGNEY